MQLNQIRDNQGARKLRKRVGRGHGSGMGKTCTRGQKGQKSRTGVSIKGFEGGQMPLFQRLPKRGFSNAAFRKVVSGINLSKIQAAIDAKKIDPKKLMNRDVFEALGFVKKSHDGVKILGSGEIKDPIHVEAHYFSKSAMAAIEKVKGKAIKLELTEQTVPKESAKATQKSSAKPKSESKEKTNK